MSSFKPQGIKTRTQQAFRKDTQQSGPRRKTLINRLVEVLELHPKNDGDGELLVKGTGDNSEDYYRVRIAKASLERNHKKDQENPAKASQREWAGCFIDEKMKSHINVGDIITLEKSYFAGQKQKEDGREVGQLETPWIHTAPEKARRGVFTCDSWNGRASSFQEYELVTANLLDEAEVQNVIKMLNDNTVKYNEGIRVPNIGVRFIVSRIIDNPKKPGEKILQYIETSDPIDWISSEEGKGAPLDSKTFTDIVYQFIDYVLGAEDGSTPPLFSDIPEEELVLSVAVYRNYLASPKSTSMIIDDTKTFTDLYRMTQTPIRNSQNDDYRLGKNLAATGVLYISDDKYDKKLKEEVERNLATRLFADSIMGNVVSFLKTSEGMKYTPHPALMPLRDDQPTSDNANAGGAQAASAPAAQKTESLAQPPQASAPQLTMPEGGKDPFADDDAFNDDDSVFSMDSSDESADDADSDEGQEEKTAGTSRGQGRGRSI